MTFGISRGVAVDSAGNVQTGVFVEVRRMVSGFPLAVPIYSDSAGASVLSNPFYSATGEFGFYAVGGAYRVRVYNAAGYDKTWDDVPVGTAQAVDVDQYARAGFTWAPESTTSSPPTSGCIRFNNADVSLATHVYLSKNTLGGSDVTNWLTGLSIGDRVLLSTGVGTELGWTVTAITNNTSWFDITINGTTYAGPAGPLSLGNSGFVSVSQERKGSVGVSPGLSMNYSSTTTASDPGAGTFRLNNATHASATALYIDNVEALAGASITAELDSWDDSTSTIKGTLRVVNKADPSIFRLYNITGSVVDSTGYRTVAIAYVAGNGTLVDTTACSLAFTRTGDLGNTGSTGATGSTGSTGATGAQAGYKWTFNSSTSSADPGTGKVGFDNATLASVTSMFISETDADGQALAAMLATWDDSTNTALRGTLHLEKEGTPASFAVFSITGTLTDNGAWDTFTVTYVASGGSFSNGDALRLRFSRTGDKGASGAGTGDMLSTNNLSDLASKIAGWDNLTAKGTDIASAATINLTTATGPRVDIAGTTTITAVTLANGSWRLARATGIFQFTASATLLVNKSTSVNYTTAVGDLLIFTAEGGVTSVTIITAGGITAATAAATYLALAGGTLTGALNFAATQTIASATTTDIGAATSNSVIVSGTTTITGLGTIAAGVTREVLFSGALTLTHNATSLILPGSANITTAANDVAKFRSLGAGNWVCTSYKKADGTAVVSSGSGQPIPTSSTLAVDTYTFAFYIGGVSVSNNATTAGSNLKLPNGASSSLNSPGGAALTGTWKNICGSLVSPGGTTPQNAVWVRTA